jgi:hypothetical protein
VLPIAEFAEADAVYGYSFVVTNLDVSTPERAAVVEHWYWHRTQVEKQPRRQARRRAAAPAFGYPQVNRAWMWGALLAVSIAGWRHQLTATPGPGGQLAGHGVGEGQAMIATLRHKLIRVPARLIRHAGQLTLRLPPGYHPLAQVLARLRALFHCLSLPSLRPPPVASRPRSPTPSTKSAPPLTGPPWVPRCTGCWLAPVIVNSSSSVWTTSALRFLTACRHPRLAPH